ncbi:MAG: AbrB/MazE/SpoVT family DNA-binding domain-containing protein [Ruminococcus sp.]|nr:AbrB/MazE/SpoVT family DNA-binding domain-containing protein [Ruminococcus sp.]MBQ8906650.1 AbrB/MazE/SpoVT family DNA-binding domain-containing protein [Ruminococcus sp.]
MKNTGIVRKVDELGRVVIPKELRNTLGINERDPLEIYVEGHKIILQKYQNRCVFCGEKTENCFMDKCVCEGCINKMKDL